VLSLTPLHHAERDEYISIEIEKQKKAALHGRTPKGKQKPKKKQAYMAALHSRNRNLKKGMAWEC